MISDVEIRAVCAKAAIPRHPKQLDEFLLALRAACAQYLRERSMFLAYSNPSPHSVPTGKTANGRKRVA